MNKRLFLKKTNVHNVSERISIVPNGNRKTVPAIRIVDGVELPKSNNSASNNKNAGKTLFDKPGDCVSRKNFEVQEVLESGDAIALEIRETISGHVLTSDLEVLILAQEGSNFTINK